MDIEGISAGNEEQKDQEQEDDETDVLNAFQSAAAKGKKKKGSKNKKMLMPEGYMTMPRGMGVTPPVYGDCDEAEPIEILTEKEEMAMLTMIVLSKHLPQPNNGEATATELAKWNVHASVTKDLKDSFTPTVPLQRLERQKANLLYQLSNSLRFMTAKARLNEHNLVPEEMLVDNEKLAIVADRLAANQLQKTILPPIEKFCTNFGLMRSTSVDRLVTDPAMLDKTSRDAVLDDLAESFRCCCKRGWGLCCERGCN